MLLSRLLRCGLLALVLGLAAAPAAAQDDAPRTRIVKAWNEPVKAVDGTETAYRVELVFDYETGRTTERILEADGTVYRERLMPAGQQPTPVPEEIAEAKAIILQDQAFARRLSDAEGVMDGGFLLYGEEGEPCGPGTRCLQIDLLSKSRTERLSMVVVDLVSRSIVHRNYVASE